MNRELCCPATEEPNINLNLPMEHVNPISSIEGLIGTLLTAHINTLLSDLEAGEARPIGDFDLDGATVFVVYADNGAPFGYGGSTSKSSAASRNKSRRLVKQLASKGMITSFRSVGISADHLVGVIGRMIGGLLGSGVMKIGDGIADRVTEGSEMTQSPARRGRPAGGGRDRRTLKVECVPP